MIHLLLLLMGSYAYSTHFLQDSKGEFANAKLIRTLKPASDGNRIQIFAARMPNCESFFSEVTRYF